MEITNLQKQFNEDLIGLSIRDTTSYHLEQVALCTVSRDMDDVLVADGLDISSFRDSSCSETSNKIDENNRV